MLTNTPLYDEVAEAEVLAALYLEPEGLYKVRVGVEDFYKPAHRQIFTAMLKCYGDGLRPDLKTLMDQGAPFAETFEILKNAVTPANLHYHERTVVDKSFARKCDRTVLELQGYIGEENFLTEADRLITDLQQSRNIQPAKSIKNVLDDIHTQLVEARDKGFYGIQTGFPKLNDNIVGLCPRHLWLMGGFTSLGKSTILSQIIVDICPEGAGVILFSVEDSRQDKMTRLISTVSGVTMTDIVRGWITDQQFLSAVSEIKDYDLHVYDDVYTLPEMDMKIKKHKLQGKVNIVCIDFVQNIVTGGEGIYDRMSEVAIGLQKMAKKHDVCVLALSQVTGDRLRGAQELESAADIVLMIEREYGKQEFTMLIKKNRPFGKTGKIPMTFFNNWTGIKEAVSDERC